jgi:hypothetical protein
MRELTEHCMLSKSVTTAACVIALCTMYIVHSTILYVMYFIHLETGKNKEIEVVINCVHREGKIFS